jgi:nucleotide-binding universal stress UspA family protein
MNNAGTIIVGVSQSVPGLQALRFAVDEARRRGMPLHAVRAWPSPATTRAGSTVLWRDKSAGYARRYVSDAFDAALGGFPGDVEITVAAPSGRADVALKEAAASDADLLVVGAPANRWRHSWVVRGCTRDASCPVIVVPPPELARALRHESIRGLVRRVIQQQRPGP